MSLIQPACLSVVSGRQAQQLDAALGELGLELGKGAQLGGAHGRVVGRVREEDAPAVAEVLVELDGADVAVGREVLGDGAEPQGGGARAAAHFACWFWLWRGM